LSGLLILGLDWLFFGAEAAVVALPLAMFLAFVVTFAGVYVVQRRLAVESRAPAFLKALLGAVLAAAPFPVCGSVFGALVIACSGLDALRRPDAAAEKPKTI